MTTAIEPTPETVPATEATVSAASVVTEAAPYTLQAMKERTRLAEEAALNPRPPKAPWAPDPPRPVRIPGPTLKAAKSKIVPRIEKAIAAKREPIAAKKIAGQVIDARREALHAKIAAFTAEPNLDGIDDFLALHVQVAAAETASCAFASIDVDREYQAALNTSSAELAPLLKDLADETQVYVGAAKAKVREYRIAEASLLQPNKAFSASLRDFEKSVAGFERTAHDAARAAGDWGQRGGVLVEPSFAVLYSRLQIREIELPIELPLPGKQT